MCQSHYLKNSGSQGNSLASGHFPVLWRTLNSDIKSSMDTFATKINTHDTDIKSDISTLTSKLSTHDEDIKSAISKSEDTIENAIISVNNHTTQQGTEIKEKIDARGCVKSIQHLSTTVYSSNEYKDMDISIVDPKKTIVLVTAGGNPEPGYIPCPYGWVISSNKIRVGASYIASSPGLSPAYTCALRIQIIEFY